MIPIRRVLFWTLILMLSNLSSASATAPPNLTNLFSTRTPTSTTPTSLPPTSTPTHSTNQARNPSRVHSTTDPDSTNHGDSLDDYLGLEDYGKEHTAIDPGQGLTPQTIWRNQILRIYLQNINGIRLENDGADMLDLFLQMENIKADIFAFVETKLATDQPFVNQLLH
jgi:hypothetical protein